MTTPVAIRAADSGDVRAVLELCEQARSPAGVTTDTEEAIVRLFEIQGSALLVAELDHHIVRVVGGGLGRLAGQHVPLTVLVAN